MLDQIPLNLQNQLFLLHHGRDSLFLEPVGFGGFPVSTVRQIPLKMLFDAVYPEQGAVFYVPEESQRPGEDIDFGFYARDIRLETGCFATSKAFTLYFLVPDYKDWIEETPVIVDAKEKSVRWKMTADGENPGWFRFQWNDGEYRPEGLYIYRESDSLSTSPIGKNGYALGETDLIPFGLENADSLFLVPDLNYDCRGEGDALYGSPEIVHLRDIRKTCPLQKLSLSDDFSPGCHEASEIRHAVLVIHGEKAHSRYFSEDAFKKLTGDNKQLLIIPGASHVDLYDRMDIIPWDTMETFFRTYLK